MDILSIALGGMLDAQSRLETTAKRLARTGDPADTVDLSAEMVALLQARNQFATNVRVAGTAEEMQKSVLDILA